MPSRAMGFPLDLALRYMQSKKRAFVSVGTLFAVVGVALGVGALTTVVSVTGGFRSEFRDKVLGVNAHVLILKYSSDFREYRDLMKQVKDVPGIRGIAPFVINPMMVTHKDRTATGVLLKGVDPKRVPQVLDLPKHIVAGDKTFTSLRLEGTRPPERRRHAFPSDALKAQSKPEEGGKGADAGAELPDPFLDDVKAIVEAEEESNVDRPETTLDLPADAPQGSIVPEGGYESKLPEDDALPAEVNPDPCQTNSSLLPGIVVGVTLQKNLAIKLGDCVQVTSPTIGFTYTKGAIRAPVAKQFRVTAIFDAGFDQYDAKLVYTDLYEAQAFYDTGDSVTGIEMTVNDTSEAKAIAEEVEERLSNGIYHTMDWEELNHGLFTALRIQQIMMSLVLGLIIVVAAFTVLATLIIVVLDKRREIAVLKAMGAANSVLLRAFIYQGGIIGGIGTLTGLTIGYLACKALSLYGFPLDPKVYFISKLPVQLDPGTFVMVGAFAVLVCLVGAFWPALHAARLRPAEAFREQ